MIYYEVSYVLDKAPNVTKKAWVTEDVPLKDVVKTVDKFLIRKLGRKIGQIVDIKKTLDEEA